MNFLQERCCILKGRPVFFNTSEHSKNEKLHLNYLEPTTSSFWENKEKKSCPNEFGAIIPRIVVLQEKKASQRHSGKLAQPQNFEKLQKLNNFFDISLDLEGLFGPPFYFSLIRSDVSHYFCFQSVVAMWYGFPKSHSFKTWPKFITYHKKPRYFHRDIFNTVATSLLPKISALIAIHGRAVYLF